MAQTVFELAAEQIEALTDLETLEARGTLRLALREAGLDARGLTGPQLRVIAGHVLPAELKARGVDQPEAISDRIAKTVEERLGGPAGPAADDDSPEAVFRRLARS